MPRKPQASLGRQRKLLPPGTRGDMLGVLPLPFSFLSFPPLLTERQEGLEQGLVLQLNQKIARRLPVLAWGGVCGDKLSLRNGQRRRRLHGCGRPICRQGKVWLQINQSTRPLLALCIWPSAVTPNKRLHCPRCRASCYYRMRW